MNMSNPNDTVIVTCEDGIIRHGANFKTLADAVAWADYGHCCTSVHHIAVSNPVEQTIRRYVHKYDATKEA